MRKSKAISLFSLVLLLSCAQEPARPERPQPGPLVEVDFPDYEKRTLPNGLTVYALQHTEQPVVAVRLLIRAGAANDPQDRPGLAAFTADLITQGTTSRTATEIAEEIEQVGGTLDASADIESTVISASVLSEDAELAFRLMTDVVMNPAFAPQEIARLQQQKMSGLMAAMEDPNYVAGAVFQRSIYGAHPYGHPAGGTLQSIPSIQRDDLAGFHSTFYAPNISALAIVGDISSTDAFRMAERWFGPWEQQDVPQLQLADIPNIEGRRIVIVDRPDAVQTEIRVGQVTVDRRHPDYFNVLVSSYILGGSASGRLNESLRVERGLTYGAFATITPRRGPGNFYAVTETRTEKTAEALQLIFDEIQRFRTSEPPANELADAKAFLVGSFPLTIEVPPDLAARLTNVFLYDLGDDYLATYRDQLAAVSAADVLRTARERISSDNTVIVLVGRSEEFLQQIESLGKTEVIPVDSLDLGSPTLATGMR